MAINREATMLAIGNSVGTVIVYSLETASIEIKFTIATTACNSNVRSISFSHDSKKVVFCTDNGEIFQHSMKDIQKKDNDELTEFELVEMSSPLTTSTPKRHKIRADHFSEVPNLLFA
jgi:Tol biopolymer transport system component